MRGLFFLFVAGVLSTAPLAAETQSQSPVDIVNQIYNPERDSGALGLDPDERAQYFSKATVALWNKADAASNPSGDETGAIDFDLSTNSQGADVKSYSIVSSNVSGKRAFVTVKLELDNWIRSSPGQDIIRYDFVLEDGRWTIDDIEGSDGREPWTLKKLLLINSHLR